MAKGWGRKSECHSERKHVAHGFCGPCYHSRKWHGDGRGVAATHQRTANLRARFEITPEQYEKMLQGQQGLCAICFRPPRKRRLAVDHDHITKRVRGLLCWWCNNRVVPKLNTPEILARAIVYLKSSFDGRNL